MLTELGLVLLLALCNAFFALSEIALIASRKIRLKHMARSSRRAQIALRLIEHPERFLSTVQVGITLITLITGAAAGTAVSDQIREWLLRAGLSDVTPYATFIGLALGFTLVTTINIVVGELVPKRAALAAPERIACVIATPMLGLSWLTAPFVWVLNRLSGLLLAVLRLNRVRREKVTEEEIRLLVAEGAEQDVLDPDERNMVNRVLRLGDRSVDSVMTPRPRIAWLDAAAPLAENLAVLRATPFSRYPVYRGSEDEVLGVLEVKRLLQGSSIETRLPELLRKLAKPLYVPGTARALDLLEEFRDAETQFALVVDEYGDIEGLVTLNDLLGAVVGRASPSSGEAPCDAPVVRRDDGSLLVDGSLSIDDLRELVQRQELPNEDESDFRTVAGMMMAAFGRIPGTGEAFEWQGLRFEVVDLDGARIDKVLVTPLVDHAGEEKGVDDG
ncbi:MAG: HlyC/CorC family transporter [Proteobacteria bacterium]|nr:HlyC/CorC family transporter [Pseudomonadota bacterium]